MFWIFIVGQSRTRSIDICTNKYKWRWWVRIIVQDHEERKSQRLGRHSTPRRRKSVLVSVLMGHTLHDCSEKWLCVLWMNSKTKWIGEYLGGFYCIFFFFFPLTAVVHHNGAQALNQKWHEIVSLHVLAAFPSFPALILQVTLAWKHTEKRNSRNSQFLPS